MTAEAQAPPAPQPRDEGGRIRRVVGPAATMTLAVVLAGWIVAGAWGPHLPPGDDTTAHLVRADFAIEHLFRRGRLDGWQPSFILGYQEFLFIGPGFTLAVAATRLLSFGLLSTPGAVKAVNLASFLLVPLAVMFLARAWGLRRRAAGVAGILSLAVNNPFGGVGVTGLFTVGLVTHQFAAPFFFLALGGMVRLLREPAPKWTALTAGALGVLFSSHGISVIILGCLFALVLATYVVTRRRDVGLPALLRSARHLAGAGFAGAGLAGFVLVPFAAHRDLRGIFTTWGTPPIGERLSEIWDGQLLLRPHIAALVAAGLAYAAYQAGRTRGRTALLPLLATTIAYLPLAHYALRTWPYSVVPPQLTTRALGYVAVLALLPLAALIAAAAEPARRLGHAAALAAAAVIVVWPAAPLREVARQSRTAVPAMYEAAQELADRVPHGARFATERDFPDEITRTGVTNPDRWLAWASRRNTLNNFNVESSMNPKAAYEAEHVLDRPPEQLGDALARLGVTHLVTVSDDGTAAVRSSDRFAEVWSRPPLAIFRVAPAAGQPDPADLVTADGPLGADVVRAEPERLVVQLRAREATRAVVPIGWSPKWHARLDGRPVPLTKGRDGRLELRLPAGQSRLELEFRPDVWDSLGLVLSLGTAATGSWWMWRRRRPAAEAPSADEEPGAQDAEPVEAEADHGPEGAEAVADVGPH